MGGTAVTAATSESCETESNVSDEFSFRIVRLCNCGFSGMAAPDSRHPTGFACVIFRFLSGGFLTPFALPAPCFLGNGAFSPRRPSWTRARKPQSVPSLSGFHISGPFVPFPGVSPACSACRQAFRSGVFSGCGFTCYLPQQELRQRATATLPRALLLREVEPGREQSGGWMSGRVFPPLATTDLKGRRHHADSHGTRRQLAHFSHSYVHARSRR